MNNLELAFQLTFHLVEELYTLGVIEVGVVGIRQRTIDLTSLEKNFTTKLSRIFLNGRG